MTLRRRLALAALALMTWMLRARIAVSVRQTRVQRSSDPGGLTRNAQPDPFQPESAELLRLGMQIAGVQIRQGREARA